ncbi:MAG TPA: hypothetical protein VHZ51_19745 [Ktedonobacteraceae bacterium]|nr:hypothetical protein [Ktedonobacteraceae bacterium]
MQPQLLPFELKRSEKPTPAARPPRRRRPFVLLAIILGSIVLLHLIAFTHTADPSKPIRNCLDIVRYNNYSQFAIATQQNEKIGNVQLVDQLIPGQTTVVVPIVPSVDAGTPEQLLDLYVYSCAVSDNHPEIALQFKQQHLVNATFTVTQAHTLDVSELDPLQSTDTNTSTPFQRMVNREYTWNNGAFVQTSFPGLYPVTSRVEAQDLQTQSNQGRPFQWLDPLITTSQMAKDLLHWNAGTFSAKLLTQSTKEAHVLLTQRTQHFTVQVTLQRLIQPDENGLWFVTQAQSSHMSIDTFPLQSPISSPTTIQGTMMPTPGHNTITMFDHMLSPLPTQVSPTFALQSHRNYTGSVFYTNTIPNQPGLLLIERIPKGSDLSAQQAAGQLLLTSVLLD